MSGFGRLPNPVSNLLTKCYFQAQKVRTVGFSGTHSKAVVSENKNMDIHILPALQDNYMYLIVDKATNKAAIVDPVDPDTVKTTAEATKVDLAQVLTTHHHWDHAGGNKKLLELLQPNQITVYGGDEERIDGLTNKVGDGDKFQIGNLNVTCLFTPCHTTTHICYFVEGPDESDKAVFTGDTLFLAGCGRFFEGTAEQMYSALVEKLSALPEHTKVYCGHEYSLQNLAFAKHVEPNNEEISEKIKWCNEQRKQNLPTVPSTIGEEKRINPFVRVDHPDVQKHAKENKAIATMRIIRKEKDSFKAPKL